MCLSTAYKNSRDSENIMAKNITQIGFDGGEIVLTDLMGAELRVSGMLSYVDLVNGVVIVNTQE